MARLLVSLKGLVHTLEKSIPYCLQLCFVMDEGILYRFHIFFQRLSFDHVVQSSGWLLISSIHWLTLVGTENNKMVTTINVHGLVWVTCMRFTLSCLNSSIQSTVKSVRGVKTDAMEVGWIKY